jgi:hypothetical protein
MENFPVMITQKHVFQEPKWDQLFSSNQGNVVWPKSRGMKQKEAKLFLKSCVILFNFHNSCDMPPPDGANDSKWVKNVWVWVSQPYVLTSLLLRVTFGNGRGQGGKGWSVLSMVNVQKFFYFILLDLSKDVPNLIQILSQSFINQYKIQQFYCLMIFKIRWTWYTVDAVMLAFNTHLSAGYECIFHSATTYFA